MAHTTTYNPLTHIVETHIQGSFTLDEAKEMITGKLQVAKDNGSVLFLSDFREAQLNIEAHELFYLPETVASLSALQGLPIRKLKRALVFKKDYENFHFFENVTITSGQNAKVFQDLDEALKWLLESDLK